MVTTGRYLPAAVLALTLMLIGCRPASAEPAQVRLDQPFVLSGGQQAALPAGGLRLRFAEVLEDSRCPAQVSCFWTGQARIAIVTDTADQATTTVEFNTNPAPDMTVSTVRVPGGYTVTLRSLEPYPQSPDHPIGLPDYRATLLVHAD